MTSLFIEMVIVSVIIFAINFVVFTWVLLVTEAVCSGVNRKIDHENSKEN